MKVYKVYDTEKDYCYDTDNYFIHKDLTDSQIQLMTSKGFVVIGPISQMIIQDSVRLNLRKK